MSCRATFAASKTAKEKKKKKSTEAVFVPMERWVTTLGSKYRMGYLEIRHPEMK